VHKYPQIRKTCVGQTEVEDVNKDVLLQAVHGVTIALTMTTTRGGDLDSLLLNSVLLAVLQITMKNVLLYSCD